MAAMYLVLIILLLIIILYKRENFESGYEKKLEIHLPFRNTPTDIKDATLMLQNWLSAHNINYDVQLYDTMGDFHKPIIYRVVSKNGQRVFQDMYIITPDLRKMIDWVNSDVPSKSSLDS
jgi:hypothetical protein